MEGEVFTETTPQENAQIVDVATRILQVFIDTEMELSAIKVSQAISCVQGGLVVNALTAEGLAILTDCFAAGAESSAHIMKAKAVHQAIAKAITPTPKPN
jgi:hypothetical protein